MILKWIQDYNESNSQTKFFVLNWLIYGLAIIITTVYCYARLDYVRSYKMDKPENTQHIKQE